MVKINLRQFPNSYLVHPYISHTEQYCWEKSLLVGPDVVLGPKYPLHLKAMLFDLVKKENFYFVSSILNMYIHICNVDMLLNYMCACICEQ